MTSFNALAPAFVAQDRKGPSRLRAWSAAALRLAAVLRGRARTSPDDWTALNDHLLRDIGETPASAEFAEASRAPFGSVGLRAGSGASRRPLSPLG